MVGQLVDVEQRGVGLHEWPVPAGVEVEGDVQEVHHLLVYLGGHLEPIVLIHPFDLLPELLSEEVGQGAHCQAIIPVEAERLLYLL